MESKGDPIFHVFYGAGGVKLDVTFDVLLRCCESTAIDIPGANGEQDALFSDPIVGVVKHITIQENDQTRVFEPQQPVHYTCELNGEVLRYANVLRAKDITGEDFAMQLVTAIYARSEGCMLKVGARLGVPQLLLEANNIKTTVVEADHSRALQFARRLSSQSKVVVRPCALAYQPVLLVGSHLESIDAMQSALIPQHNATVMLHSGPGVVSQYEEKQNTMTTPLPSLMATDFGLQRRTLRELEEAQDHVAFDTLVFDSQRAFQFLLSDAAPMLLQHAKTVIVGVKVPHHHTSSNYVRTQMTKFGFQLNKTFAYRNTFEICVWRAK